MHTILHTALYPGSLLCKSLRVFVNTYKYIKYILVVKLFVLINGRFLLFQTDKEIYTVKENVQITSAH